jgi:hypothetical protein
MHKAFKTTALVLFLGGCGYVDAYEEAVYDHEPVYCYQSLAAVQCFKEPQHTDRQRLVNYYGPHPSRADEPDAPEVPELQAPTEEIEKWVKDPEPVPQPRVRINGVLRTVGTGKALPASYRTTLDEETATELKAMRITEPVPPTTTKVKLQE